MAPESEKKLRLLLVDDDADFVTSLSGILELEGHPVETAGSVAEATARAVECDPDVAFIDIRIGRESGFDLIKQLQQLRPELTCVVVTAYSDTSTAIEALKAGAYDYLRKPFETSELFAVLRRCAERKRLIAAKAEADKALAESEARFRVAFETSPDAIVLAQVGGEVIDVNPGFEQLTGYRRAQVVGRNSQEVGLWKNPADRDRLLELLQKFGQVNNMEAEFRTFDGRIRVGLMSARAIQLDGAPAGLFVVRDVHDIKEKEKAIMESEERYRGLVSNIPGAVYRCLLDKDWTMQYISAPIREISGYGATDFVRNKVRSFASIVHPDDSEKATEAIMQAISRKEPFAIEYRILHADGTIRWVQEKGKAVLGKGASVAFLDGVIFDVTEMKMQEDLLIKIAEGVAESTGEDFFRALVDRLSVVLEADYAFIGEMRPESPNVVTSLFAYADGKPADNFTYDLAGTPCETVTRQGVCTFPEGVQQRFPQDEMLVDMGVNAYVGAPLIGNAGVPLGILVVLYRQPRKIPHHVERVMQIYAARAAAELERLGAEEDILLSEKRYRELSSEYNVVLDGIRDAIVHIGPDFNVIWGNKGIAQLRNVDIDEITGQDCSLLWGSAGARVRESAKWVLDFGTPVEILLKTEDNKNWGVKFFPIQSASGAVTSVIQIASDLTEKTRLRDQAARSAHLAALGELAAGVAHEINNPTGMILLDIQMLRDALGDLMPLLDRHGLVLEAETLGGLPFGRFRQEAPLVLDEILEGAERIKRIVEELKDFSKPSTGEKNIVDLSEIVRKAVSLVRNPLKKATDHFSEKYAPQPLLFAGNARRLEQVMVNLLLNACYAMSDRTGAIHVETRDCPDRDCVQAVVRDEGVGIEPTVLKQITDPFFTTRRDAGGTGLGLSVSSRIIDEHEGSLSFESQPGAGTTVTVELPTSEKVTADERD